VNPQILPSAFDDLEQGRDFYDVWPSPQTSSKPIAFDIDMFFIKKPPIILGGFLFRDVFWG